MRNLRTIFLGSRWLLPALCLCTALCAAGRPALRIYAEQVLAGQKDINALCKDRNSKLWLGTETGLYLYDGYEATAIAALKDTAIRSMVYSSADNQLWLLTNTGILLFDCGNLGLKKIRHFGTGETVVGIAGRNGGGIVYATKEGYICELPAHGAARGLVHTGMAINRMTAMAGGDIYFAGERLLYRYRPADGRVSCITSGDRLHITSGLWAAGNTLLVGTWYNGLQLVDVARMKNTTPPSLGRVNAANGRISAAAAGHGLVFAAFDNYSFFVMNPADGSCLNISEGYNKVFNGRRYSCVAADSSDVAWVGTNDGLIKLTIKPQLFGHELAGRTPAVSTRAIVQAADGMYLSSYSGIFYRGAAGEPWQNLSSTMPGNQKYIYPYAMLPADGQLYAVMESKFLYRYDGRGDSLEKSFYRVTPGDAVLFKGAYAMAQGSDGLVWIGTRSGLASYHPAANELHIYNDSLYGLDGNMVKSIFFDTNKKLLYAATGRGLYLVDQAGKSCRHIWSRTDEKIKGDDMSFVCAGRSGRVWVGTAGSGIYILDAQGRVMTHLDKEDGLADNNVYSIVMAGDGKAWISTNHGLSSYDPVRQRFYNYYEEDGLTSNEFNHNSYLRDAAGTVYLGGVDGVNTFNPDTLGQPVEPFRIYISATRSLNRKGDELVTAVAGERAFSKKGQSLTLDILLGVTDYVQQDKVIFLYRVKGMTDGWVRLKNAHALKMDGLPYGDYDIELRALNYRGRFSENTLAIQVSLPAPFYYRWWFILLLVAAVSGIAYAIFMYRLRSYQRYQQLRVQIASDLHDEVGSILTSIGMYSDNIKHSREPMDNKLGKIDKIAALSRTAIASMRDILWAVDARNDRTSNLVEHIRNQAEELLVPRNTNIHFNFDIDKQKQLDGPVRQHLYFIIKEAIHNIAKHSRAEHVYIDIVMGRNGFRVSIANDGVPADRRQGMGQGLRNMAQRAEKIQAQFTATDKDGLFTITISG